MCHRVSGDFFSCFVNIRRVFSVVMQTAKITIKYHFFYLLCYCKTVTRCLSVLVISLRIWIKIGTRTIKLCTLYREVCLYISNIARLYNSTKNYNID